MEMASIWLYWIAFVCLTTASVQFFYQLFSRHSSVVPPQLFAGLGGLALTASIGLNSSANDGTPLTGANQLVLGAWALVVIYFIVEYFFKFKSYGVALIPSAVTMMAIAQIIASGSTSIVPVHETLTAQMQGAEVAFHVALIVFANALLLIGCIASGLYIYQDKALKSHSTSKLSRRLPALANLERLAATMITYGLPIYTAGQSLGILRAIQADVVGWYLDPRVLVSAIVAATFLAFIVMYYRNRTSGVVTAWVAVVGGLFVIVLMIIARTLPVGFHLFGVITS